MQRLEIIVRRVEFSVPLVEGRGATHVELKSAIEAAAGEYWQATGAAIGSPLPDEAIRLTADANAITVFFELEKRQ